MRARCGDQSSSGTRWQTFEDVRGPGLKASSACLVLWLLAAAACGAAALAYACILAQAS